MVLCSPDQLVLELECTAWGTNFEEVLTLMVGLGLETPHLVNPQLQSCLPPCHLSQLLLSTSWATGMLGSCKESGAGEHLPSVLM